MSRTTANTLCYYDRAVVGLMIDKYDIEPMEALRRFVTSETHQLLENTDYGLLSFGAGGIFDIWEAEVVTGDPRNSIYIRGE